MKEIVIDNVFKAIRQLPLDVEFARVEQMVLQQPLATPPHHHFLRWLSSKNFLLALVAGSVITAGTLIFHSSGETYQTTPAAPVKTEMVQASDPVTQKPKTSAILSPKKENENKIEAKQPKKIAKKISRPHEDEMISVLKKSSATLLPEGNDQIATVQSINDDKCESTSTSSRVRTAYSGYCSFGDDDKWIKAFVREMKKDNIISDTANLRFTISGDKFRVNGKLQESGVASKYNDLYEAIMGERLNTRSCISLSVGSSCSLSKEIEN